MTAAKSTAMRLAALLVLQALWLEPSRSESPALPAFQEEISKQESIYRSDGENVPGGYTVDRSLADYADALPAEFEPALANLGPDDRWLDIGAGRGQAILDYYAPNYDLAHLEGIERRGRKARAVALSIEDRRTSLWRQEAASLGADQIRYLFNKRLREYSREELGQFQVITDVFGGFSYTANLSLFMENVLGILELNGSFYTLLQDVHLDDGTNRRDHQDSPYLTEIIDPGGYEVKVCSWLKRIACVEVTCESKVGSQSSVEAFHIHKVCNDVTVPALTPLHYEAGTPPERRFQLRAPLAP